MAPNSVKFGHQVA